MPYRQRTIIAGRVMEIRKYHTYKAPHAGEKRKKRNGSTPPAVKKNNLKRTEDELRWLMNANFRDGDLSITTTYSQDPPASIGDLKKDAEKFVRKLRALYKKKDISLRYVYVLGAGKHRRHIHITINDAGLTPRELQEAWGHGRLDVVPLYSGGQYAQLAAYYMQNAIEARENADAQEVSLGKKYYYAAQGMRARVIEKTEYLKPSTFRKAIYEKAQSKKGWRVEKGSETYFIASDGYEHYHYTLIKDESHEDRDTHEHRPRKRKSKRKRSHGLQHGVHDP